MTIETVDTVAIRGVGWTAIERVSAVVIRGVV